MQLGNFTLMRNSLINKYSTLSSVSEAIECALGPVADATLFPYSAIILYHL